MSRTKRRLTRLLGVLITTLVVVGCSGAAASNDPTAKDFDGRDGCTKVYAAVSSEKVNLFTALSQEFQNSPQAKALPTCADIIPKDVASGEAARLLKLDWPLDQTDKPAPTIWSPASTAWTDQVKSLKGSGLIDNPVSFARSPLVFAMPEQMAQVLGWPKKPIGYKTLHDLCLNPKGWGEFGGTTALWGAFKLAKTNPTSSTSGLNTLLGQAYAASDKSSDLTVEDVTASRQFTEEFESCVIHYGDTTGAVLNEVYKRDQDGDSSRTAMQYTSAVAVEETSLINYNLGNPTSSVIDPGATLTPPRHKLVAIYPEEGSLESNNPLVVLGTAAPWVSPEQRQAAQAFQAFVVTPQAQALLDDSGFRPLDPKASLGGLFTAGNGVDPKQPTVRLPNPATDVTLAAQQQWNEVRKPGRVLFLFDVSGSMNTEIEDGLTFMNAAIQAAQGSIDHFRPEDELGVWAFTTGVSTEGIGEDVIEFYPLQTGARESLKGDLSRLVPSGGTPLYDSLSVAHSYMKERAEPGQINAIILLSDGFDEGSDQVLFDQLIQQLKGSSEIEDTAPVRIFPIAYGEDAPLDLLRQIASASGGQVIAASDPRRIDLAFKQAINNF